MISVQLLPLDSERLAETKQLLELSPVTFSGTLEIDNTPVPTFKNPEILGVTFEPLLTFNRYTKDIQDKK